SAVTAAQDLATSLNTASDGVQSIRTEADAEITTQFSTLNTLLSQFEAGYQRLLGDVLGIRLQILGKQRRFLRPADAYDLGA
ncbi:hypothetical protein ACCS66_38445, partial [Rhizobium ruizarguesonis]